MPNRVATTLGRSGAEPRCGLVNGMAYSQGRPHFFRPTLNWRTKARWTLDTAGCVKKRSITIVSPFQCLIPLPWETQGWHGIEQMAGYVTTTATVGDGALSPPALCAIT